MMRQDEGEESPESTVSSSSCDTVSSGRRTCRPEGLGGEPAAGWSAARLSAHWVLGSGCVSGGDPSVWEWLPD